MYNFIIQTTDEAPKLERYWNTAQTSKNPPISEQQLQDILTLVERTQSSVQFAVAESNYGQFKDFNTIGSGEQCNVRILHNGDKIVGNFQDVILFIDSFKGFYDFFVEVFKRTTKSIEFNFDLFNEYTDLLEEELIKICEFLLTRIESKPIVKNIEGFLFQEKFPYWGDGQFFIGLDDNVYSHPSFYYAGDPTGIITSVNNFSVAEMNTYYTNPHLICCHCETFYCSREIYFNKRLTGEFKVPCKEICKLTTLLNKYSRRLFNLRTGSDIEEEIQLDVVDSFEATKFYNNLPYCETNKIKGLDFSSRMLKQYERNS